MKIAIRQPQAIYELGQRDNQEDSIWPLQGQATDQDFFFILCDGMGGHEHGEVASRIVSQSLAQYLRDHVNPEEIVSDQVLGEALEAAYQALDQADDEAAKKMGTTLCLLLFHRGGLTTMHIGDSRIYHVRPSAKKLLYQSKDHSLVYDLYQAGEISYEEMATSPQKNIITRAMQPGKDNRCKPSVVHITDLRPGDYLYICSDGMLEQMDNDALCQLFSSQDSDEAKRQQLIEATKGNKDNHSAYFVGIASVSSGEGDESLLDDEQTSKDNALNIRPVFEAEEVASDVEEVSVVEETPRVGQPLRPQPLHPEPQAPKGGKGKLVLGAAAALVALACAYFFLTPKEEKAAAPLVPHTEKIGDSPSRQSADPARETVAREVRVDQPASSSSKSETTVRRETAPQKASPAEPQKNPTSGKADPKKDGKADKAGSTLESSKGAKTLPPPSMRQRKAEDPIDAAREKLKGAPQGGQKQKSKPSEGIPV